MSAQPEQKNEEIKVVSIKRGRGRPKLSLCEQDVEDLAGVGLTAPEIAAIVGSSQDTVERNFAESLKRGRENCKASIKRTQFDVGVNGKNVTMLIWLGKQYLGQTDKVEQKIIESSLVEQAKAHLRTVRDNLENMPQEEGKPPVKVSDLQIFKASIKSKSQWKDLTAEMLGIEEVRENEEDRTRT